MPPSFNDKMFEVMAVYGAAHMALSQISTNSPIARNWHRICQCHSVRITIEEGAEVPIQVDGEAWLQKPGIIKIQHKVYEIACICSKLFKFELYFFVSRL